MEAPWPPDGLVADKASGPDWTVASRGRKKKIDRQNMSKFGSARHFAEMVVDSVASFTRQACHGGHGRIKYQHVAKKHAL